MAVSPPTCAPGKSELALEEIAHLARLLQEILDMARIEAHAVRADPAWVTAGAIVEAAAAHAGNALARHRLVVDADEAIELQLDPRLTSAALAHVLENAAKYSAAGCDDHRGGHVLGRGPARHAWPTRVRGCETRTSNACSSRS